MKHLITYASLLTLILALAACGNQESGQTREKSSGGHYELPVEESKLPSFELNEIDPDSDSFELTSCDPTSQRCSANQALWEMLKIAKVKVDEYVATGNNVFAAGILVQHGTGSTFERCVFVEIQERSKGKKIRKEVLTPAGQPANCAITFGKGISAATMGALVKVENNYLAGVGIGAVYNDGQTLSGCAAGAYGYQTSSGERGGNLGGFCASISSASK